MLAEAAAGVTVEEFALAARTTEQTVRTWCRERRIRARRIARRWLIHPDELRSISGPDGLAGEVTDTEE